MRTIERLAMTRPLPFVFLATVAWIVVAGVAALMAAWALHTPMVDLLPQSLGTLTATACLLVVMKRWGWLRAAGVTALGSRRLWLVTAGLTVYVVLAYQVAFFGGTALNISSSWESGGAQSILVRQVVVGAAEEFLFRGFLLYALVRVWGNSRRGLLAAVTVPALIFGLTHIMQALVGNPMDDTLMTILNCFIGGLWCGALVLISGSIWPAVLIHVASNASFQITALNLGGVDPTVADYAAATAAELPLVVAGLWLLVRKVPGSIPSERWARNAKASASASTIGRLLLLLSLTCTVWVVSCAPEHEYAYQVPEQTNDGWATASLEDVGMNEELLGELIERIDRKEYRNVHGIVIVKNGKLVFEEYFEGYTFAYSGPWSSVLNFRGKRTDFGVDTPHNLASVTKSFTSALVGMAIDRGYIRDVDEPVFSYFPDYSYLSNEQTDRITLEHLLTMTSGLKWNELELWLGDMDHDLIQLFLVPDPMSYILAKPVVTEPGTAWYYNGGGVNVLGEVIREASGMRMDDFAERYLFAALGITEYQWDHINSDMIHASGNLELRPRDMAKFGYLYLNGGTWKGQQIISQEWVEKSTKASVSIPWESLAGILGDEYTDLPETHGDRYGYLWWLKTYHVNSQSVDTYFASGWGGQRIFVFPSLDMVVVLTGGNYGVKQKEPVDEIITRYVLPAVQ